MTSMASAQLVRDVLITSWQLSRAHTGRVSVSISFLVCSRVPTKRYLEAGRARVSPHKTAIPRDGFYTVVASPPMALHKACLGLYSPTLSLW